MGWKSKLLFLILVYFAGFATAIYHLAPDGRQDCTVNAADNFSNQTGNSDFRGLYDKACAKAQAGFSNIDTEALKDKFNLAVQKLKEMSQNAKTNPNSENK